MARKFAELRGKMSAESRARSAAKTQRMVDEMALDELRAARHLTQEHLATLLGVNQSAVSKLERRVDMYVSTLGDFIRAMGGELEIRAVFPEGAVRLAHLGEKAGAVGSLRPAGGERKELTPAAGPQTM
jgi:DNA-binding XRE family transcriptional regulator